MNASTIKGMFAAILLTVGVSLAANPMSGTKGMSNWKTDTITATIVQVNPDSGMVTVKGPQGREIPLAVNQGVDLSALKPGDKVRIAYARAMAVEFREPTQADRDNPFVIEGMSRAPEGGNPMGGGIRQIRALVKIQNVDKSKHMVTVKGPQGNEYDLYVPDAAMLDQLKNGTERVIVYTVGLAMHIMKQ